MTQVNIHEAKTHLSRLIERVADGETITIARAGTPVADLVPHRAPELRFGLARGRLAYDDDTFDDLDQDIIDMFEGQ